MNESKPDASIAAAAATTTTAAGPGDAKPPVSGMEINLGDFTRTQGLMKSLRLLLNNQVAITVEDLASGVSDAGRKFNMGDVEQANIDVARLYAAFGQRTSQWENQARTLEQNMKRQAANNPKSISLDAINRMKAEQIAVRTRISTAEVHFRRLQQGLDQAFTNLKRRPLAGLSAGFLAAFKAASIADRPALVQQAFAVVTPVEVTIRRGQTAGYDIQFAPRPAPESLLFLTATASLVRLHELGHVVVVQDLETGGRNEQKLVEFVKLVQSGAWLLQ
jgi:hypothetical protein